MKYISWKRNSSATDDTTYRTKSASDERTMGGTPVSTGDVHLENIHIKISSVATDCNTRV